MNPQLLSILQQGIQHFQLGNLVDAERLISQVLKLDPSNPPALQIIGLIKATQGNFKESATYLKKAIKISPNDASLTYNLAKVLLDSGNSLEALVFHERAAKISPHNPDVWLNYSKNLANLKKFSLALNAIENALQIEPNNASAWNNKGALFKELNRIEEALDSYQRALQINPNFAEAHYNQGIALNAKGSFTEAINSFDQAIKLEANHYAALNNKGITLSLVNKHEEALECFDLSLKIRPSHTEALINKAACLSQLKRFEEAITILSAVLVTSPSSVAAHVNLGLQHIHLKQYESALFHFEQAISFDALNTEAWINKGLALKELNRLEDAVLAYQTALEITPDYDYLIGIYVGAKMQICDWRNIDDDINKLHGSLNKGNKATTPFPLLAITDSEELHLKAAKTWIQAKHPSRATTLIARKEPVNRKFRIGYFSADFRNHPIANLTAELFECHNKDKFELIAFSYGADDQSDIRKRIINAFDKFLDIQLISDKDVASMARDLEIDIAIDLTGLTADARPDIFAHRAAPIQINYLGYPGTMGAEYIDYILADKTILPQDAMQHYCEKVLYMPACYQVNDTQRVISERVFNKSELGLPEEGFIFCNFNNNYKITPETFSSWMRILGKVEKSVLWLFEDNPIAAKNLKKEAELRGISSSRLIFAKRISNPEHLARYRIADLFLDTLPYNAHTTASDALWVGLPILTQKGNSFAGRVAASLIKSAGIPELITESIESYEEKAIELATNPEKLNFLKKQLDINKKSASLFNPALFAEQLEEIYESALKKSSV